MQRELQRSSVRLSVVVANEGMPITRGFGMPNSHALIDALRQL